MIEIVIRNVNLRPTMSPMRPKNAAPNGRTTNPVAKTASVDNSATVSLPAGKNSVEMIAARVPKM